MKFLYMAILAVMISGCGTRLIIRGESRCRKLDDGYYYCRPGKLLPGGGAEREDHHPPIYYQTGLPPQSPFTTLAIRVIGYLLVMVSK